MAYFLKKSNFKKGVYLQIYQSFYSPERKHTVHKSFKSIGYVHELISNGIADPIAFYSEEVKNLNQEFSNKKHIDSSRLISDSSPEKFLGYFPFKNINDSLGCKKYIDLMQSVHGFKFNIFNLLSSLIYSRLVQPCSKSKTYLDVIPKLFEKYDFSLDQLYSGLNYIGSEYEKIIEIYNHQIIQKYKLDTSHTYFDCTNFYFEIDKEDDFRAKGVSKENRKDPIVGLGLMLDANQLPIGMKLFPGNESEKPILRDVVDSLKKRNNITGRTIHVSDKGLNCINNILFSLKSGDGYIFSKSVKNLPETEKTWILLNNDYVDVHDNNGELLYKIKECVDDFPYTYLNSEGKKTIIKLREKRVVTYNPKLAEKQIYEINKLVEKAKELRTSEAKKVEYGESSKFVSFIPADKKGSKTDGKVKVEINEDAIQKAKLLAGYNLLVTSETLMSASNIYSAYHNLWRIEESFKIMKSQLDARPVFLQKQNSISGHFLVCYLSVLLSRLLQFKVLKNNFHTEVIFDFTRDFKIVKISDTKYINLAKNSSFIKKFAALTSLPLTSYFLNNEAINKMLNHRF